MKEAGEKGPAPDPILRDALRRRWRWALISVLALFLIGVPVAVGIEALTSSRDAPVVAFIPLMGFVVIAWWRVTYAYCPWCRERAYHRGMWWKVGRKCLHCGNKL